MDDTRLRAALGYSRFTSVPKMLLLDTTYLVVGDVANSAVDLGWDVVRLPTPKKGHGDNQFVAALLTALVTHQPDFILTMNHLGFDAGGVLSQLLERYEIPVASWFVDHPMPILGGANVNATTNTQVFCFERTALEWLEKSGYEAPIFLPTASNGRYFCPDAANSPMAAAYRCGLSFVGNSWWYKARVEPSKTMQKAARALASRHKMNRHTLAETFERAMVTAERKSFGAAQVALAEASMRSRQRFVNAFAGLELILYGDAYWKNLCPKIRVHPYLDYHRELPVVFAVSDVNLNISAEQMPTAVNQRVWDVPAVNGFLLTDAQEDALDVFEDGVSMAFYTSVDEAVSKAKYYLDNEEKRRRIAQRGMEIVNCSHRMTHRLQTIYNIMKKRFD